MDKGRSTVLIFFLLFGCSTPDAVLKLHSMPLVFVERRLNPIGLNLVMGLGEIHDGRAPVSISSGRGDYYLEPTLAGAGDAIPFEIDEERFILKVIAMGLSRHQAARDYGLDIDQLPLGRDCGVFEILPASMGR
jgi:hypothetical protein